MLHARKGTQLTVGYRFLPFIFFYLICNMSTPPQPPFSSGKAAVVCSGFGQGYGGQAAAPLPARMETQNNQALNVLQPICLATFLTFRK